MIPWTAKFSDCCSWFETCNINIHYSHTVLEYVMEKNLPQWAGVTIILSSWKIHPSIFLVHCQMTTASWAAWMSATCTKQGCGRSSCSSVENRATNKDLTSLKPQKLSFQNWVDKPGFLGWHFNIWCMRKAHTHPPLCGSTFHSKRLFPGTKLIPVSNALLISNTWFKNGTVGPTEPPSTSLWLQYQ